MDDELPYRSSYGLQGCRPTAWLDRDPRAGIVPPFVEEQHSQPVLLLLVRCERVGFPPRTRRHRRVSRRRVRRARDRSENAWVYRVALSLPWLRVAAGRG